MSCPARARPCRRGAVLAAAPVLWSRSSRSGSGPRASRSTGSAASAGTVSRSSCYKLRTMVAGPSRSAPGSPSTRATRGSARRALLRRTSLDELPNLVNVLRGEMSVVGPRPTVQVQVDRYSERQRGRLAVNPGLTGWAQVQGRALPSMGRADRARPLVRRARARCGST